jgi:hypothetical protein
LVPHDTNESEDVYEFVEGRPQLITLGTGIGVRGNEYGVVGVQTHPGLVGVSADGFDVYFATYEHLVEQDLNGEQLKIYDARTGGGFPFVRRSPECAAADECHGNGQSSVPDPTDGTGAALTWPGNVLPSKAKKSSSKKRHRKHRKHGKRGKHHRHPGHKRG